MFRTIGLGLALYLSVKTIQILRWPRAGYDNEGATLRDKVAKREPALLIGTVAIGALFMAYANWWSHRRAAREYAHAVICFGQLRAADKIPHIYSVFRRSDIYDGEAGYKSLAEGDGKRLALGRDTVAGALIAEQRRYERDYAALATHGNREATERVLGVIEACLNNEWGPHDELLNP